MKTHGLQSVEPSNGVADPSRDRKGAICARRVRVGIVLPDDRTQRLTIEIHDRPYAIAPSSMDSIRSATLTASADRSGVGLTCMGISLGHAATWFIRPMLDDPSILDKAGITVHAVPAGRGFHWSTPIDPVLPGTLELSAADGHLCLVNELSIETYLAGVITAEMSGTCPIEFLKAQAIAARSWMLAATERKHADLGIDYCNDDCCQRYQGLEGLTPSARVAVEATKGQVLVHASGAVVDANYSKCCGGIVEAPEHVWGFAKAGQASVVDGPGESHIQSLQPVGNHNIGEFLEGDWLEACDAYCGPNKVPSADLSGYLGRVDDGRGYFRWSIVQSAEVVEDTLRSKFFERTGICGERGLGRLCDLSVTRRGTSGRATRLSVIYDDHRGQRRTAIIEDQYWIRHALDESFLPSSAFDVRISRDDSGRPVRVQFVGAGWGHGAGMCQIGALGMALSGFDHRQILQHYFAEVSIASADS